MSNSGSALSSNYFAAPAWRKFWRALARTRCLPLFALTLACLVIREQFPFSNFPMYATFSSHTFYVYLADGAGRPLPAIATIGMSTPTLKKVYVSEIQKERDRLHLGHKNLDAEQQRAVGERLLARLRNSSPQAESATARGGLSLYEVTIDLRHGQFEKRTEKIAAIP